MGLIQTISQQLKQSNSLCLTAKDIQCIIEDIQNLNEAIELPNPIPYRKYVSLISQQGENKPAITVLENDFVTEIEWIRLNKGLYTGRLKDVLFTENKTVIFITKNNIDADIYVTINEHVIVIHAYEGKELNDGLLENVPIEIRVYK